MRKELPSFESYGDYSSSNYGVNALVFSDGKGQQFYYSYKTLVAFYAHASGLVVRRNDWAQTTGKHLNWINSDKSDRVDSDEFQKLYNKHVK